jgi:4'-phosphopantetheinyl transferase
MGCITKHYISEDTAIGVWNIEEDINTLLKKVPLEGDDIKRFSSFRSNSRKLEFLSVRALLMELIDSNARIVYNKNNKPFLKDGSRFISISHSHSLTAILISKNERVGIDLEYMGSNITTLAFKFINKKEKITKDKSMKRIHLYIHWCAKEAIYKICDKEGIIIRRDITIEPFDVKDSGIINGRVKNSRLDETFSLYYAIYNNYAIVWTRQKYEIDSI